MTTKQKLLIGILLVLTVIFWIAIFAFPNLRLRPETRPKSASVDTNVRELEKKYGSIDSRQGVAYVRQTLKEAYHPDPRQFEVANYIIKVDQGYIELATPEWTVGNKTIYAEIFNSLKGGSYSQSNLPIRYEIYVKEQVDPNTPQADVFKMLKNYYVIPDSVSLEAPKEFAVQLRGKAREVVWKNPDNTLESRSVWNIGEENVVYFLACRVFPDSDYYENETCYYGHTNKL